MMMTLMMTGKRGRYVRQKSPNRHILLSDQRLNRLYYRKSSFHSRTHRV